MGRDSSVGIPTRYGLDGPGIESRWWRDFPHPSRPALGAHTASCTMGTGSFPRVKRPGRDADHPPSSKRRSHERVGLYLYSPSGSSWPVTGWTLVELRATRWMGCWVGPTESLVDLEREISRALTGFATPDRTVPREPLYQLSSMQFLLQSVRLSAAQTLCVLRGF